jgi:hypothetical protein
MPHIRGCEPALETKTAMNGPCDSAIIVCGLASFWLDDRTEKIFALDDREG